MEIRGNGSIQALEKKPKAKCRRWRLIVSTDCGKKTRVVHGTWTDACIALEAFKTELRGIVPNSDTFASYAASWRLWREASGDFAPGTLENDRREVSQISRSHIAAMRMDEITPEDCRNALVWLKKNPAKKDGELSNTTMNSIFVCMKSIFAQAVDDGRLASNPMAKMRAPKCDTRERDAMSPVEIAAFLDALDTLPLDGRVVAMYLMACLGLRRSESCALYDEDVYDGFAHVHLAVKERDGSIGEPKSKAGVRVIPVPPRLYVKICEWRDVRREIGFEDAPTLACNTDGGVLRPQLLQRWWTGDAKHRGMRDLLGYPRLTMHQLRHSNLTMMARHMSPFDLQRYAGWSSIEPARVYIHADMDAVTRAVDAAWSEL